MTSTHDTDFAAGRVTVHELRKEFRRKDGGAVMACDGISLDIDAGEFVVLLGPSGCGKTTLLRMVAGLERPDSGAIRVGSRVLWSSEAKIAVPPEHRNVGMVFQSYALWPHMSVLDNVGYPLRARGVSRSETTKRVQEALRLVDVGDVGNRLPSQLSGGQQQRIALARALVGGSEVILFDEPLSNVDARVRSQLRDELRAMHQQVGFTAIYVTHDQQEAMSLATRLLVLDGGSVLQDGPPDELFRRPATLEIARFVGSINELEGTLAGEARRGRVTVNVAMGPLVGHAPRELSSEKVVVVVRPNGWSVSEAASAGGWQARIVDVSFQGERRELTASVAGAEVKVWVPPYSSVNLGDVVNIKAESSEVLVYDRP